MVPVPPLLIYSTTCSSYMSEQVQELELFVDVAEVAIDLN